MDGEWASEDDYGTPPGDQMRRNAAAAQDVVQHHGRCLYGVGRRMQRPQEDGEFWRRNSSAGKYYPRLSENHGRGKR